MGEQQELLLAAVWESSTDAMRITDFKGKVINVNNAYCILTGFEKDALIGKLFNIVYDKKEQVDLLNLYKKYVESEKTTKRLDEKVTFLSGRQCNIESSYSQITMSGKKYVLAIIRDITEFMQAVENDKRSQIELQKSEEKFRTVANYTYDWEYWLSPEEEILFMTPSCERVTGYKHSEFIADKKLHIKIVHPDDKNIYYKHLHIDDGGLAAMLDKEEIVFRIINKNGEVRWINHICRLIKSDDGRNLGRRISNRDITVRKLAEEEARKNFELLVNLARLVPGVIYQYRLYPDGHSSFPYSSQGINDIYEVTPEEVREDATPVFGKVHPDDFNRIADAIQESARTLQTFYCEFRVVLPRQGLRWRLSQAYPERMEDGGTLWHGIISDITERKHAEEALLSSQQIIEGIMNAMPVRVFWKNRNLVYLGCNSAFVRDAGFTDPKEIIGKDDFQMGWSEQADLYRSDDRQVIESGLSKLQIEEPQTTPDGKTITLLTNKIPLQNSNGDVNGVLGMYMDITERKQTEEKTQLLAHTIKSISEIITITDFEDKFTFVNQAFCDKYGYSYEEVIGKHVKILLSPNNPPGILKEVTKDSRIESWKGELLNLTKDGREFPISLKTSKIVNEKGEIFGLVGIAEDITEQKQIEDSLRKSEEKYHSIFESTGTATLIVEEDTTISMANNESYSLTGYSIEELIGTKWTSYVAPESLAEMMKYHSLRRMEPEKAPKKYEVKLRNKNGDIRDAILDIGMITDSKQSVVSIIDITDRKHAEAELFQARNDWEDTFNTLTDMITIHDENYNIIRSNAAAKSQLGLPELNNLFGSKCFKYYHGIDCPPDGCPSCDCLKSGLPGIFELFEPHLNLYLEIRAIPRFDINNHLIGLVHVVRDITKRKMAEEDLKASEEKYRNLIETMPEGFYRSTVEGYFVDVNPALVNILGYDSKEELMKIYIPEDLYFTKSERFEGVPYNNEFTPDTEVYRVKKKDGTEIWIEDHAHYIQDGSGKIIYHEGLMRDITESLRARNAILEAKDRAEEANRLKSSFLANMSHEIRTPLNGILGFAEILNGELINPDHLKYTRIIEKSGKRLLETLHMILTFAKLEAEKQDINYSDVKIGNVIEETVQTFEAMAIAKNLYLKSVIKTENITTKSDEKFLIHILNNLVNNAIKFTNTGGITIELSKENNSIFIKVRDTGIGIAKENLEIIFDEFRQESEGFSRSFEGTGLGLSITKQFVEMMNGKITVESEQGTGSVFTVELPYEKFSKSINIKFEKKESVVEKKKPVNESVYKTSILIVEDDEDNRSYIETLLSKFDTDSAVDGLSAISKAKEKTFDLILLDINLGKGMNGLAVINEIRKMANYKKTPIVAMTAFVLYGDKEDFLSAGCTHYLGKPFEKEQLLDLINKIMKKV